MSDSGPDAAGTQAEESAAKASIGVPYLPSPMLGYRCNLAGCCCGEWHIHFSDEDLLRLAEHLPEDELPEAIGRGLVCVVDQAEGVVDHFELSFSQRAGGRVEVCRFLSEDGRCSLQERFGIEALPGICVDFPVVAWRLGDRVDLGFQTVCPAVLDALWAEAGPVEIVALERPDPMFRRRLERVRPVGRLSLGGMELDAPELIGLRNRILEALEDTRLPVLDHLQAICYGFSSMINAQSLEAFELRYDMPPMPFVRFFHHAMQSHSWSWLLQALGRYRRFIQHPEIAAALCGEAGPLAEALEHWEEGLVCFVEPVEEELRPCLNRFLAHRYFSCLARFEGEVVLTLGRVAHVMATGLRYAAAFCMVLGRRVDLDILKAAMGAASYIYHNDLLPPSSSVWFVPEHFRSDEPPPRQF